MTHITKRWFALIGLGGGIVAAATVSAALALSSGSSTSEGHPIAGSVVSLHTVPDWALNRLGLAIAAPASSEVASSVSQQVAETAAVRVYGGSGIRESVLVDHRSLGYGPSNLPDGPIWVVVLDKVPVFGGIGPQDAGKPQWTGQTVDLVLVDARTGVALGEFATQVPDGAN